MVNDDQHAQNAKFAKMSATSELSNCLKLVAV